MSCRVSRATRKLHAKQMLNMKSRWKSCIVNLISRDFKMFWNVFHFYTFKRCNNMLTLNFREAVHTYFFQRCWKNLEQCSRLHTLFQILREWEWSILWISTILKKRNRPNGREWREVLCLFADGKLLLKTNRFATRRGIRFEIRDTNHLACNVPC